MIGEFADEARVIAATARIGEFDGRQLRQAAAVADDPERRGNRRSRENRDPHALDSGCLQALEAWTDKTEVPGTLTVL